LNVRVHRKFNSKLEPGVSSNQSQSDWNWKQFGITILGCGLLGITYLDIKSNTTEISKDARSILSPSDIQHSSTTSVKLLDLVKNKFYIHRSDLENKINYILHKEKPSKQYYVVYGP
jgi:hypothetical protein